MKTLNRLVLLSIMFCCAVPLVTAQARKITEQEFRTAQNDAYEKGKGKSYRLKEAASRLTRLTSADVKQD